MRIPEIELTVTRQKELYEEVNTKYRFFHEAVVALKNAREYEEIKMLNVSEEFHRGAYLAAVDLFEMITGEKWIKCEDFETWYEKTYEESEE